MITVLLVDDQALFRSGLRMVIESQPDMRVVGEAGDGAEAIVRVRESGPDIVLMDLQMPGMDGVQATAAICAERGDDPKTRIIALTTFDFDERGAHAIQAGASGFLLKDSAPEFVLASIREVAAGGAVVAPSTAAALLKHVTTERARSESDEYARLTDREKDIFLLVARGLSNAEIAAAEYVSETTVKTHISRILAKLGLRDRVQIVVYAFEHELVRRSS